MAPVSTTEVPVAAPIFGVVNVGLLPKEISEEVVTPDAKVVPDNVPAAAVTVMSAEPLNATPLIFREVVSVAALPVVFWLRVGKVQLVSVPEEGVPSAPPETRLPLAVPVKAPIKVVAVRAFVLAL